MHVLQANAMHNGISTFTRQTKVESVAAEHDDNGAFQHCQGIFLFVAAEEFIEQTKEVVSEITVSPAL